MNKVLYIFLTLLTAIFSSCSKDEDVVNSIDLTWEEEEQPEGTVATVSAFEPGDAVTRSTWVYNGQKLVFGWKAGDQIGIVPTAGIAKTVSENEKWEDVNLGLIQPQESDASTKHPESNDNVCYTVAKTAQSTKFITRTPKENSQTVNIYNNNFAWSDKYRWTAYYPYETTQPKGYDKKEFSYEGQVQNGLPDYAAYMAWDDDKYLATEADACAHLGNYDYMISPETKYDSQSTTLINFQFRHIGAVARFKFLMPEKDLTITSIRLICNTAIFYTKGTFNLISHPYKASATDYGTALVGTGGNSQVTPDANSKTNNLVLNFKDETAKTVYDSSNKYKRYAIAYLMMYPITYSKTTHGSLYAYVMAKDSSGKELRFISGQLSNKTMKSGYYYQWNGETEEEHPIELTATLLPWQDIVGGGIDTDLTK